MSTLSQQEQFDQSRVRVIGRDPAWEKNPWAYIRKLESDNATKDKFIAQLSTKVDEQERKIESLQNRVGILTRAVNDVTQ